MLAEFCLRINDIYVFHRYQWTLGHNCPCNSTNFDSKKIIRTNFDNYAFLRAVEKEIKGETRK